MKTFWNTILSWIQCPWLEREEKRSLKLSLKYELVCFYDEWIVRMKRKSRKLKGTPEVTEILQTWYKACLGSGFTPWLKRSSIPVAFLFWQQDEEVEQLLFPSAGSRPPVTLGPTSVRGNTGWTGLKRKESASLKLLGFSVCLCMCKDSTSC